MTTMKKLMTSAAAIALVAGVAGTAQAASSESEAAEAREECRAVNAEYEQKLADNPELRAGYSATLMRDIRELRDAANILAAYGKGDACQELAEAIQEMAENPQELQRTTRTGEAVPAWDSERELHSFERAKDVKEMQGRIRAEEMIGSDVRGRENETIGEISDMVISPDGQTNLVVVSYGGFLGMGEEESAVPFDVLKVSEDGEVFYLPMSEDSLEDAPRFERGEFSWVEDQEWIEKNDAFYREHGATTSNN